MIDLNSLLDLKHLVVEKTIDKTSLAKDAKVQMAAGHTGSGTSSSTPSCSKPNILKF